MTRIYFIMMSVVAVSVLGTQPVQADSNFYLGSELGANFATSLDTIGSDTDRASVCDEFINPGFASVAGCTDPGRGMGDEWTNRFDNTEGLLAGVTVGYRWRGRFRLEAEYSYRDSPYDQTSPLTDASGATLAKLGGELERAEERIGSVSAHNLFGNVYYDLINASRFTPYIGFGVGVGFTDVDYGGVFARAGDPRVITTGAGLANTDAIRQNLAGTTTSEQTKLEDTLFGYQVLFGVDYALTDAVALGIKGRWTNYDRFSDGGSWDRLRSHSSDLRRDGSEPVTYRQQLDDIEMFSVSLTLKYHF